MALKAILESVDGLPDPIKSEYVEKDGRFVLSVEPVDGYELDDVSGLKTTLSKVNGNFSSAEKELKKFGSTWNKEKNAWDHSIDPIKAKTAIAKYDEFVNFDPNKEADKVAEAKVEAVKTQLVESHTAEMAAKEEEINLLSSTVSDLLIKQQATMALAEHKGDPELLMPHIERQTRVGRKDGKFFAEVIDKDGQVRIGNAKAEPMTISQLVEEMKKSPTYGKAFEGEGTGGSGKQPNGNGGGSPTNLKRSTMSPKDKAAFLEKHGQQEFLKLPR